MALGRKNNSTQKRQTIYARIKKELEAEMLEAAAALDFERAAKLRDMIRKL